MPGLERQRKTVGGERGSRYSELMRVKVLYFGVLRDMFGAVGESVELADGATVGGLLGVLRGRTSNDAMAKGTKSGADEGLWRSLAVAVNREYGSASIELREGDEVALLPPVSGGCCAHGEKLASLARVTAMRKGSRARFAREEILLKDERERRPC
jgi:molybdopterin converting factor small subunit